MPASPRRLIIAGLGGVLLAASLWIYTQREPLRERQLAGWSLERLLEESDTHPEDSLLQRHTARRLLAQGNEKAAMSLFAAAIRARPDDPAPRLDYARACLQVGRVAEAQAAARRALEIAPQAAEAYLILGESFLALDSTHGAVTELRRFTELRPRDPRGWTALARAFLEIDETGNAQAAAEKALSLDRRSPEALHAAGEALRRQGRFDEARDRFDRSLQADSEFVPSMVGLGHVLLAMSRPEGVRGSLQWLETALERQPENVEALFQYGHALTRIGRMEEAVEQWRRLLKHDPYHRGAHQVLAQTLAQLDREKEAAVHRQFLEDERRYERDIEAVAARYPQESAPPEAFFELARIHLRYQRPNRAIAALQTGLAGRPDDSWATETLARLVSPPSPSSGNTHASPP